MIVRNRLLKAELYPESTSKPSLKAMAYKIATQDYLTACRYTN